MFSNERGSWAEYKAAKSFCGITLWELVALAAIIVGANALASYNYLLFHTSVEFFSVCIAFSIFIVGVSAQATRSNNLVVIAGATYLFVAVLDTLHALSYKGMPFLNDYEYYGPQFWIAARYLEAAGLLAGIWAIDARLRFNALAIFGLLFALTAAIIVSILYFRIFPICFVPGTGLTAFKVYSEYAIVGLYAASLWMLHQKRSAFEKHIYELVRLSIVLMALMEVCFTFYKSDAMSDFFNELGHLIKIFSFYLLCKALVIGSLRDPLILVSRELRNSEERARANAKRLADILDLQREIASSNLNYSALLQLILERMMQLVACDGACLELSDNEEMVYEAAAGLAAGFVGLRLKAAASLSGLSMSSNDLLRADDIETDPRVDREACRRIGLRSMTVMPLRYDERTFGVLKLMSGRVAAFTPHAEQALRLMGEFLGVTIGRKRAEEALRESQERLQSVLNGSLDPIFMKDREGRMVLANPATCAAIGKPAELCLGKTDEQFLDNPADARAIMANDRRIMLSGEPETVEEAVSTPSGTRYYVNNKAPYRDAAGNVIGLISTARDVTERKRAEAALRESEERYRSLFEHMLDGFAYCQMVFDEQGRADDFVYLAVNHAFGRLTGLTDVTGKRVTQIIPKIKELAPEVFEIYGRVASTGCPERFEIDFKPLGIYLSVSVYSPAKGFFVAVFDNISERKRAEEALRASEERFRGIFQDAGTGIAIIDLQGRFQACNPAFAALLGYSEAELLNHHFPDLIHPEDREENLAGGARLRAQEIASLELFNRYIKKDGSAVWVHKRVSMLHDLAGKPTHHVALVTDMTERKRYEEHIRLLLREVNHRSKNMLAVVQAVARQTIASSPEDFLARFGERIRALAAAQDLLIKNEWKGVEVRELVRSQLSHFSDLIGTRIILEGAALFITASASQTVGMALHELATNAGKYGALSNGEGRVTIEWRLDQSPKAEDTFTMGWTESGGPAVHAPERQGFGSTVVGKLAEMKLDGKVDLRFASTGVCWRLECAAAAILGDH